LQAVTLWKVTPAGVLASTNTLPTSSVVFPTSITVDRNGASVVGIIGTARGSAGFFVNADRTGLFGKLQMQLFGIQMEVSRLLDQAVKPWLVRKLPV
jgi:hypothetical protein